MRLCTLVILVLLAGCDSAPRRGGYYEPIGVSENRGRYQTDRHLSDLARSARIEAWRP